MCLSFRPDPQAHGSFTGRQSSPRGASQFVMIQSAKFTGKWFTIVLPELGRVREKGLVGLGWAWARLCVYVSIPPPKTNARKKATFSPRCNNHAPLGLSPVIFCLSSKELSLRRVMSRLTIFNADENSWTIQCLLCLPSPKGYSRTRTRNPARTLDLPLPTPTQSKWRHGLN